MPDQPTPAPWTVEQVRRAAADLRMPVPSILGRRYPATESNREAADMLDAYADLLAAFAPYLKDGETPAERVERDFNDTQALLTLLAQARAQNADLETGEQSGDAAKGKWQLRAERSEAELAAVKRST